MLIGLIFPFCPLLMLFASSFHFSSLIFRLLLQPGKMASELQTKLKMLRQFEAAGVPTPAFHPHFSDCTTICYRKADFPRARAVHSQFGGGRRDLASLPFGPPASTTRENDFNGGTMKLFKT